LRFVLLGAEARAYGLARDTIACIWQIGLAEAPTPASR